MDSEDKKERVRYCSVVMFTVPLAFFAVIHVRIKGAVNVFCKHFTGIKQHVTALRKLSARLRGGRGLRERSCRIVGVLHVKVVRMWRKCYLLLKGLVTKICLVIPSDSSIYFRND